MRERQSGGAFVLEVAQRAREVQAAVDTILLHKATGSLDARLFMNVVWLVILTKREAHLGAARSGQNGARISCIGAENVGRGHQDDSSCAAAELSHALRSVVHTGPAERISATVLVLDLLKSGPALRLIHHYVHAAEAFLESLPVLFTLKIV